MEFFYFYDSNFAILGNIQNQFMQRMEFKPVNFPVILNRNN